MNKTQREDDDKQKEELTTSGHSLSLLSLSSLSLCASILHVFFPHVQRQRRVRALQTERSSFPHRIKTTSAKDKKTNKGGFARRRRRRRQRGRRGRELRSLRGRERDNRTSFLPQMTREIHDSSLCHLSFSFCFFSSQISMPKGRRRRATGEVSQEPRREKSKKKSTKTGAHKEARTRTDIDLPTISTDREADVRG